MRHDVIWLVSAFMLGGVLARAQTPRAEEVGELRRAIADQRTALEEQRRKLDDLMARLERLESQSTPAGPAAGVQTARAVTGQATPAAAPAPIERVVARDSVGDLNSGQIVKGNFPGSIQLPGVRGLSLGFGGFIKTLAFHDTNAEGREAVFLPATLGAGRDDRDGSTSLTAELTRFNVDARGSLGEHKFRGYLEWDMSGDTFKWRHGYLTWDHKANQMLAGKYWSNFMDLQVLPEGLGEPTVSGAVFTRQAQFRYTRRMSKGVTFAASIEDPASSDIIAAEPVPTRTAYPDFTSTLNFQGKNAHLMIGGLVRRITIDPNNVADFGTNGWGIHAGSHVNIGKDKLAGSFVYGSGLGRYLLGVMPSAGAFVDLGSRTATSRKNYGGLATYRHQWTGACRTTFGGGYAAAENDPRQPDSAFRASMFGLANYMCTVNKFLTMGVEYDYGRRWNKVGGLDSSRVMFGMQLF